MTSDAERIVGLYERHARAWVADRKRARFVEQEWLDRFASLLPECSSVLDIGCGAGEPMATHLIARGHGVTGIDSSPTMISLCQGSLRGHRWLVADMRGLELGERFSGVIAWDSFFHLTPDDQRNMFPIFRIHAAPGAALLFSSGPRQGEAIGSDGGEPLYHASLAPAEYRALLDANGFSVLAYAAEDPTCGGRTVWLARHDKDG
jgi:SAM-dependent methyltransferase